MCIGGTTKSAVGTLRAVKVPEISSQARATKRVKGVQDFKAEINMIFFLSQPRSEAMFVKAVEWTSDGPTLRMEYLPCGDVDSLGIVSEIDARSIIKQVLQALEFLHAHRIAHHDVKPRNIMVKNSPSDSNDPVRSGDMWWVKLADFGVANYYHELWDHHRLPGPDGTVAFLAPDILNVKSEEPRPVASSLEQAQKADVWAVGITLFTIAARGIPLWRSASDFEALGLYNKYLAPIPEQPLTNENLSLEARRFLRFLVQADVASRPTATQALAHSWLQPRGEPRRTLFFRQLRTVFLEHQAILELFFSPDQAHVIVVTAKRVTAVPVSPGTADVLFQATGIIVAVAPPTADIVTVSEDTGALTRLHVLSRTVVDKFLVQPIAPGPEAPDKASPPSCHIVASPTFAGLALARENHLTLIRSVPGSRDSVTYTLDSRILGVQFLTRPTGDDGDVDEWHIVVATSTTLFYISPNTAAEGRDVLPTAEGRDVLPTVEGRNVLPTAEIWDILDGERAITYPTIGGAPPHSISISPDGDIVAMTTADGETWTTQTTWGCWRRGEQVSPGTVVAVPESSVAGVTTVLVSGRRVAVQGMLGRDDVVELEEDDVARWSGVKVAVAGEKRRVAMGYAVVKEGGRERRTCVRVREVLG
ncbi:kinase-like domain-containing protein [Podospora conica]|nr:kinase-like domain-containing protein [Schizothecium conicum]